MRTLNERLANVRAEHVARPPQRPSDEDRLNRLARWFDARTDVTQNGTVLVVERSVVASEATVQALAQLAPAAYFDTETTGLSTGAGNVLFLARVAPVSAGRIRVWQDPLPE